LFSLGFRRCQASPVPFSDHQASSVVISDLIGSSGFAGDHLGFLSHRISSPGIAGDQLGISDLIVPPGLPLVALGLDLLGFLSISILISRFSISSRHQWLLVSISSVCSRSRLALCFAGDLLGPSRLSLYRQAPPMVLGSPSTLWCHRPLLVALSLFLWYFGSPGYLHSVWV
jgi:hypothetical protein